MANTWAEEETEAQDLVVKEIDVASMTEEERNIEISKALLKVVRERLQSEYFITALEEFREYRIVRHERVFQLAFYLFGVRKW
jgi:hypothetical protein